MRKITQNIIRDKLFSCSLDFIINLMELHGYNHVSFEGVRFNIVELIWLRKCILKRENGLGFIRFKFVMIVINVFKKG